VEAYLGFRSDTGDRLKAALTAEPDFLLAHCLCGYFMMLFGQRAMVSRAQRSLEAAQATARNRSHATRDRACGRPGALGRRRFRRHHGALGYISGWLGCCTEPPDVLEQGVDLGSIDWRSRARQP
jgi:hypothetical protein